MKITLDSLKLISDEYPLASTINIEDAFLSQCKSHGWNPSDYVMLGKDRIVLAGYVCYLKIYKAPVTKDSAPVLEFTFNQEVYDKWGFGTVGSPRTIFCNKLLWTSGQQHLTTLNDNEYLDAIRGIEDQLMTKYCVDKEMWMNKIDTDDYSRGNAFIEFSDMIKSLFIRECIFN